MPSIIIRRARPTCSSATALTLWAWWADHHREAILAPSIGRWGDGVRVLGNGEKLMTKKIVVVALGAAVFAGGFVAGAVVRAQSDSKRVFELRTYTAPEGKLGELHKRFRDH